MKSNLHTLFLLKDKALWMLGCCLLVILSACSLSLPNASPSDPMIMTPEEVVESFYNWYMQYPGNPMVERAYRQSPFLTDQWIQEVDEALDSSQGQSGFDPFLCAQDIPEKVFVQPANITQDTAVVVMKSSFAGHSLTVDLQRTNGADWKISAIRCR